MNLILQLFASFKVLSNSFKFWGFQTPNIILSMMLTRRSQVRKCLLNSKMEFYILYKRVWSNQRTRSRNERGGATSSEVAPEYFGACKARSCVIIWKWNWKVLKLILQLLNLKVINLLIHCKSITQLNYLWCFQDIL